jgi:hypothetical protein
MSRDRSPLLIAALALLLGACNLPGQPSGVGIGGEEGKPVDAVIADAQKDMAGFKTVHVKFATTARDTGAIAFDISSDEAGNVSGSGMAGDATFDLVVFEGKTYIKGQAFWLRVLTNGSGPDASVQAVVQSKVGDHWVVGLDSVGDSTGRGNLNPAVLADCLRVHGTLSKGGTQTIDGRKAVEVRDQGDSPGGRAGSRFIAVDSPHVLLRATHSGTASAGTSPANGRCKAGATPAPTPSGSPGGTESSVTTDYSDYGKSVTVTRPSDTVDLGSLFNSP